MEEAQRVEPIPTDVEDSSLSESMQCELNKLWANTNEAKNFTIFRTPHNISQSKKNLFEPSVISIGPFHRGQKHLQALEEQKWRFLQDFLSRGNGISLNHCISEMELLETRTRRCYNEKFGDLDSKAFVKMMLLDGCFVLEYFLRIYEESPIVEVAWNSIFIQRDLLLHENQIPFFIVKKLIDIGLSQEHRTMFVKFIAFVFLARIITKDSLDLIDSLDKIPDPPDEIHHLVHLCYHYLVPNPGIPVVLSSKPFDLTRIFHSRLMRRGGSPQLNSGSSSIPSATELKQKGLKFIPKSKESNMLDISFEYGVLKIPRLKITDSSKPIFANIIAFEHSKYGQEHSPFTSFIVFFDKLVNTPNDVTILQECGIVENWLGSEEELTHFINQVTEGASIGNRHYLAELYTEVNRYIGSSWHKQRAKFVRDYCSSPFATISLFGAIILLFLTLEQSFFAAFAYFRPQASAPAPSA